MDQEAVKKSFLQRIIEWWDNRNKPTYINEYVYFNKYNGGLELDVGKWIRSDEYKEQVKKMRKFEEFCRKNNKDGSFSFYD